MVSIYSYSQEKGGAAKMKKEKSSLLEKETSERK